MIKKFSTDWLSSETVYFNEVTKKVSHNFYNVVDWSNFSWDSEGLRDYLEFGYSVFRKTQIKNVVTVASNSILEAQGDEWSITAKGDPVQNLSSYKISETSIWDLIRTKLESYYDNSPSDVVIPTSGGLDSRILNALYPYKQNIQAFTYGNTYKQIDSEECVLAREVCNRLNIPWKTIKLGNFHEYFELWDQTMGPAVHAHGMYHLDFYQKIRSKTNAKAYLSGIFGDVWAGTFLGETIESAKDLGKLSFSHGLNADPSQLLLTASHDNREEFWNNHKDELKDPVLQTVWLVRFKIILISYLLKCPKVFGFEPQSPFLDADLALAMVQLPYERRKNRVWQREWFQKNGLDVESTLLKYSSRNSLDRDTLVKYPLKPLSVELLKEIIQPRYVEWINQNAVAPGLVRQVGQNFYHLPKICGLLMKLGFTDNQMRAYNAYLTLKPLQTIIEKRNAACR